MQYLPLELGISYCIQRKDPLTPLPTLTTRLQVNKFCRHIICKSPVGNNRKLTRTTTCPEDQLAVSIDDSKYLDIILFFSKLIVSI